MRKHHVEEKLNVRADILQISGIPHQGLSNHFASFYPELSKKCSVQSKARALIFLQIPLTHCFLRLWASQVTEI
jgi:hypothetical protein